MTVIVMTTVTPTATTRLTARGRMAVVAGLIVGGFVTGGVGVGVGDTEETVTEG